MIRHALPFLSLIFICVLCYANTTAGYFCCDEQLFLGFMHTVKQVGTQNILWTIFATKVAQVQPLLDCYRPLPDVVWLAEYVFGGTNPLWYHATNIFFHCGTTCFAFVIAERLTRRYAVPEPSTVAFLSAASCATFPLTSEAVCSPTNITTLVCTFSFFGSVACYLVWQDTKSKFAYAVSALMFSFGLLSKEMCAALPVVLCALEWKRSSFRETLKRTAPMWLFLAAYLAVRIAVLGPIIGGYRGSLGEEGWRLEGCIARFFGAWPSTCLFPINANIESDSIRNLLFGAILACYSVLMFLFLNGSRSARRLATPMIPWLVLAGLTTATVWNLEPGLAGGRHLYVLSLPIFLLLVATTYSARYQKLWTAGWCALIATFAITTVLDNDQYVLGTQRSKRVREAIECELRTLPRDQKLVVIKPPFQANGTYLFSSSNMLHAMCSPPLTTPDLDHRVCLLAPWFNTNHQLISLSRLERLSRAGRCSATPLRPIGEGAQASSGSEPRRGAALQRPLGAPHNRLVFWDDETQTLKPFQREFGEGDLNLTVQPVNSHFDQSGNLSVLTFMVDAKRFAEQTAVIEVRFKSKRLRASKNVPAAISLWCNAKPQDALYKRVADDGESHAYRFVVGNSLKWLTGKQNGVFEIRLPSPDFENNVESVRLIGRDSCIPRLTMESTGLEENNDGVYQLTSSGCVLRVDASKIVSAKTAIVEISRQDGLLEEGIALPWRDYKSTKILRSISFPVNRLDGSIPLKPSDFPADGVYEIEAGTTDGAGHVGFYSDPIFIRVGKAQY